VLRVLQAAPAAAHRVRARAGLGPQRLPRRPEGLRAAAAPLRGRRRGLQGAGKPNRNDDGDDCAFGHSASAGPLMPPGSHWPLTMRRSSTSVMLLADFGPSVDHTHFTSSSRALRSNTSTARVDACTTGSVSPPQVAFESSTVTST